MKRRLARVGDVDGDTVPDLVAGALRDDTLSGSTVGSALLFSGANLVPLHRLSYALSTPHEGFGISVCGVDDVDGDGLPDVLIGAFLADPSSRPDSGRAYLFSSGVAQDTDGDGSGNLCDADDDGDGQADMLDCSPQDPTTYPDAAEINDGLDNQCEGDEGYGLIDEISGEAGFRDPDDKTRYSWPSQEGATIYEIARSPQRDFATCTVFTTDINFLDDSEIPPSGVVFHYLVRPVSPNTGSWGARSSGEERILTCGP